jgi:ABC-2 type transport system ATP-binding protein
MGSSEVVGEGFGNLSAGSAAPASADAPLIRVAGLIKDYKQVHAVRGVHLDVRRGEIYGLIGPDGAGKSSLMKAIAGVLAFDAGRVDVFGVTVDSEAAAERIKPRIGFLPQGLGLNLYPELTVEENIDFFARLRLVPELMLADRKARLLRLTRLDPFRSRAMKHLSGGMKQKLGLICTLIHAPELAILDEPTTGVDALSRRDFWGILAELLQEQQMTALVSTAYMDEASRFHRMSFLANGSVLASGTPAELQARVEGTVVTMRASAPVAALAGLTREFAQAEARGAQLRVFVPERDHMRAVGWVQARVGDVAVTDIRADDPELEDVVVALLLREGREAERVDEPAVGEPRVERRTGHAIEATDLVRDFGGFRAVDGVSFQVRTGEIFGLLGANGAGKTTVMKMLTGILRPTGGEGTVAGFGMRTAGHEIKQRIGYMSQAFSLYLDLTVMENIQLFAGVYGLDATATRERLQWLVRMAGLGGYETVLTRRLPMGVRQRLALGCALVHRPDVLFLDEPTSGVDPIGRRRFWEILSRLAREEGVTILITTHYLTEAEHCDRLALMHAGRIVAEGSPSDLKAAVASESGAILDVATDRPIEALDTLTKAGLAGASLFGTHVHAFSREAGWDESRVRECLASAGIAVHAMTERPLTLEDVFIYRILQQERAPRTGGIAA